MTTTLFLLLPFAANAGLILTIDNDSGFARLTLSGSDVASSGSSLGVNGYWLFGPTAESMFNTGLDTAFSITSGAGSLNINGTNYGMFDIYVGSSRDDCCTFGLRAFSIVPFGAGDALAMTGVFTTNLAYSVLNEGVYDFAALTANVGDLVNLRDGYQIRIGRAVSEPGTLMLLGIGLLGLGMARRKTA